MVQIQKDHLIFIAIVLIVGVGSVLITVGFVASDLVNSQKDDWQKNFEDLRDENQYIHEDVQVLTDDLYVDRCLMIGDSLVSYYDNVRESVGPTGSKYWQGSAQYWQNAANFAAKLGLHDLGRFYWPSVEDYYYYAVGKYSYDTASNKIAIINANTSTIIPTFILFFHLIFIILILFKTFNYPFNLSHIS